MPTTRMKYWSKFQAVGVSLALFQLLQAFEKEPTYGRQCLFSLLFEQIKNLPLANVIAFIFNLQNWEMQIYQYMC